MELEENKLIVRRFWEEVFNEQNLDVADEIFAPDHVLHVPNIEQDEQGLDTLKALVALPHIVSPDIWVTIEDQIAEGGLVVTTWAARGTLIDRLRGGDSDDEVTTSGVNIYRVSDYQIRETWWHFDPRVDEPQRPLQWGIRERVREWWLETRQPISEEVLLGWCCNWFTACCF